VDLGWSVALADVDADALEQAAVGLRQAGAIVLAVPTDVADADSVQRLADRVVAELGVPHVVCNNAGVNAYGYRAWEAPPSTWRWIWDVNVMGVVHGISAFVPMLLEAGRGRIVNTASVAGLASASGVAQYAASKHAVLAVSETLRFELAEAGSPVGVTAVCPGLVATGIGRSGRLWPAHLGEPATHNGEAGWAYSERLEAARADAPGPEGVAKAVLDAIAHDRFLAFPDEDTELQARAKRMAVFEPLDDAASEWF
jgi:NAD(P)-dependent dehydrogenase (short-subunit alcohol dehydrogenase family)